MEAHYPCLLQSVSDDTCIWVELKPTLPIVSHIALEIELIALKLKPGYYQNILDLLKIINDA